MADGVTKRPILRAAYADLGELLNGWGTCPL